jgi:Matrixin
MGGMRLMRRLTVIVLLAINALCVINLIPGDVSAHPDEAYYVKYWRPDSNVRYKMDNGVPDNFRAQVHDGFAAWSDRAGGRAPNFIADGPQTMQHPYSPCAGPNGIFYRNFEQDDRNSTAHAFVLTCGVAGSGGQGLQGFTMIFDNQDNWYIGDGDVPDNKLDVQSIATHEVGHATGWGGHFESGASCFQLPEHSTMCDGFPGIRGTKHLRTLEEHDIHTLNDAYPNTTCPPVCRILTVN